jgi:pilus assembly protein CpaF
MQAMNTGHGGSMATTHANTPTDALRRIESLCLQSGIEMPMVAIRAQVASAIHFIVCCERLQDGSRKTIAVSEVQPLNDKGDYRTQDLWLFIPVTKDDEGKILGYHAPTGILPSFLAKARAYGFTDLTDEFFDPRTYGLPPPPLIHGTGAGVETFWAPSLKYREEHQPDPASMKDEWRAFEEKLKTDARAKADPKKAQVQVPAGPTPQARPAQAPSRPSVQGLAPVRPPVSAANRDDATPPPTRNPLLARKPAPESARETGDEEAQGDNSVELSDSVMDVGENSTAIKPNPLSAGRKPTPGTPAGGVRPPVKPPPPRR